jgi:hypothetical protein
MLLVASMMLVPLTGSAEISTTTLEAYYTFDEESGVRYDSTDNSLDLTDNNTVGYETGVISNSALFTYSNSEYFSSTDSGLDFGGDFSYSFWAKTNVIAPSSNRDILVGKSLNNNGRWSNTINNTGLLVVQYYDNSGNRTYFTTDSAVFPDNTGYHHIAVSVDVSDTSTCIVYVDGEQVACSFGQTSATSRGQHGDDTTIGAWDGGGSEYWDGSLDEFALFSSAISTTTLVELYNDGDGCTFTANAFDCGSETATTSTTTSTTTTTVDFSELILVIEMYLTAFWFCLMTFIGYRLTKAFI